MQKKFGVNIHNVGETTHFLELKNSQTSDSLHMIKKKMKTYNLGKLTVMYFLGGISALHIYF
jgi:hypothetical protein